MMGAMDVGQYSFAPALASALLHSLWQDGLLAVGAWLALGAMARAKAATRHNAAMAFLAAMVAAPAVQFLRFWHAPGGQYAEGLIPAMTGPRPGGAANVFIQDTSPLAAVLVLLWLLGVGLMLLRHAGGLRAIAAMERGAHQPLPPAWRQRVDEMRRALCIARDVAVRLSDEVLMPCAARLLRPVIWLPLSLLTRIPAGQLEALLAHELAHIARKDWLWNGVQCVAESLLFFHPAAWWLGRRIRQEREHACDDLAVMVCGDAIALAEALAGLERARRSSPHLVLAAHGGSLMQRITRLLSGPPSRGRWRSLAIFGALTVSGALVLTQMGLAGGLPDLQVEASTDGVLGPGDYRQISANGVDRQRFYRESIDSAGRRTELYREDGAPRPITADVRRWIAGVSRLRAAPPPPVVPVMENLAEYRALIARIAGHPDVVARLGTPAVATSRPVDGNVRLDQGEGEGEADIRIELSGPRGRAIVAVEAEMTGRAWTLRSLQVE